MIRAATAVINIFLYMLPIG